MKTLYFASTILTLLLSFGCGDITPKKKDKNPESDRVFLELTEREMNGIKISLEPGVEICGCIKTSSKDFEAVWATACAVKNGLTDVGVWAITKNAGTFSSVSAYTTLVSDFGEHPDVSMRDDGFQEAHDKAKEMFPCK